MVSRAKMLKGPLNTFDPEKHKLQCTDLEMIQISSMINAMATFHNCWIQQKKQESKQNAESCMFLRGRNMILIYLEHVAFLLLYVERHYLFIAFT